MQTRTVTATPPDAIDRQIAVVEAMLRIARLRLGIVVPETRR